MKATVIIEEKQILQKIKRIAYQILESNIKFDTIILAGINGNGFLFAQLIQDQLLHISDKKIVLCEVIMDKKDPRGLIKTSISQDTYLNQSLVLVDDVLNSGTTLMYGVKHFRHPFKTI